MTLEERQELTNFFFDHCKELLQKKGADYNPNGQAFEEVKETAAELGISPEKVLWVYTKKHYSAIRKFLKHGRTDSESIEERLTDLANYMALIFALLSEGKLDAELQHSGN